MTQRSQVVSQPEAFRAVLRLSRAPGRARMHRCVSLR
jgi:hypothetical protein